MYRNIVVAFDGSDGARAALRQAVGLALSSGGTLHLVGSTGHLEEADQGVVGGGAGAGSKIEELLEQTAGQIEEVPVVTRVVAGGPIAGIIDAAAQLGADLIVTGSRGRATMPQAVLGRVTSGVVSNSPCDVLVVQPGTR